MSNDLRQKAKELWKQSGGTLPVREIAEQLGVSLATVKSWKRRDDWGQDAKMHQDASVRRKARTNTQISKHIEENSDLTDREKDFCLHYVATYNAAQAAVRSGIGTTYGSSKVMGWELLQRPTVQQEIQRLKEIKRASILADADDLVEMHMRIAFADIGDFVVWAYDKTYHSNRMAVKTSTEVDSSLVEMVSEGKQGFKIKLKDAKASMEFLERYFLVNPMDQHKIEFDKRKLALEERKIEEDSKAAAEATEAEKAKNDKLAAILSQLKPGDPE